MGLLDGVLRWLVQVTGLEPKLLTLVGILIVYAASAYRSQKKVFIQTGAPNSPPEGELMSAVARIEGGLETVAKYLVNMDVSKPAEEPTFTPRHEYEVFLHKNGVGSPPRSHHRPENGLEEELYFPVPGRPKLDPEPGFFLPLPIIERDQKDVTAVEGEGSVSDLQDLEAGLQEPAHSATVTRTLEALDISRKAGRTEP